MEYFLGKIGDYAIIILIGFVVVDLITNKKNTIQQFIGKLLLLIILFILKLR